MEDSMEDFRETNPALHLLFVKRAVKHLLILDRQIQELHDCSNLNMLDAATNLRTERDALTTENTAYADADEIVALFRAEELRKAKLEEAQEEIDSWPVAHGGLPEAAEELTEHKEE
jgi:hypothetical protein